MTNNLMRAFLATDDFGLACAWTGRPRWFFHHMGLGETIGYSARLAMNNKGQALYTPTGSFAGYIHMGLMGDPTLRMFPVKPVANLTAEDGLLIWDASVDGSVVSYYVYGAIGQDGPYQRLATVSGTSWTYASAAADGIESPDRHATCRSGRTRISRCPG